MNHGYLQLMCYTNFSDVQTQILYKWGDAAVCSFTWDSIRKAQD